MYIFRKGISQGIYLNCPVFFFFFAKKCIFEKSPKRGFFLALFLFNKGKNIFEQKLHKFANASKYMYLGNVLLLGLIPYF